MNIEIQKAAVLIAFALALLLLNLMAGSRPAKVLSYFAMWAAFGAAAWVIVCWVFL